MSAAGAAVEICNHQGGRFKCYSRQKATLIIEKRQRFYNNERPHSVLGNRTPASVGRERRQEKAA